MAVLLHRPAVLAGVAVVTLGTVAASAVGLASHDHGGGCDGTVHHGRYVPLQRLPNSEAYGSRLTITGDSGQADFGWYAYSPTDAARAGALARRLEFGQLPVTVSRCTTTVRISG